MYSSPARLTASVALSSSSLTALHGTAGRVIQGRLGHGRSVRATARWAQHRAHAVPACIAQRSSQAPSYHQLHSSHIHTQLPGTPPPEILHLLLAPAAPAIGGGVLQQLLVLVGLVLPAGQPHILPPLLSCGAFA